MHLTKNLVLLLSAAIATAKPVPGAGAINPGDVYIESVDYNGSGCHSGTGDTQVVLSDDRQTMTVIYSNYAASSGPGIPITQMRQNCLLNVKVHTPKNYRFSISQTTFHGYENMGATCTGYIQASYWFSTQTGRVSSPHCSS
jgi:Domain of unknown function (DUF4360)